MLQGIPYRAIDMKLRFTAGVPSNTLSNPRGNIITGFKPIMNRKDVIFIMTSNNLDQIDKGIQNRSILIDMNVPPINDWRPILRRVYENAGLPAPPDAVLDQVV